MSRRGKNSVKSAMLRDASHAVMSFAKPAEPKTVAVNNHNPLFHYLQTMFPNYDNTVLHSVLEQEGNSIERAIEVLLSFADAESATDARPGEEVSVDDWIEDDTPSNVFAVPVMPPVTSQNSGRDHVVLCEYQKKKKIKANRQQRAKRRQQRAAQEQARVATPQPKKKVRWVPLQDFITETRNSFDVLRDYDDDAALLADLQSKLESTTDTQETDSNEDTLLSPDEIRESWEELEATLAHDDDDEEKDKKQLEADSGDDFVSTDEEWLPFTPAPPSVAPSSEDEAFVVIEEKLPVAEPEVCDTVATEVVEQQEKETKKKMPEQVVVVKLYYSASDIHRLRFPRSAFTFAKLHGYAATYLDSKCQLLAKEALPRAFALTYVDDEGDVIHLCSEEELAEALRLHDEVFWAEGNQPIMRLHIKPLVAGALHAGHVTAGRAC